MDPLLPPGEPIQFNITTTGTRVPVDNAARHPHPEEHRHDHPDPDRPTRPRDARPAQRPQGRVIPAMSSRVTPRTRGLDHIGGTVASVDHGRPGSQA